LNKLLKNYLKPLIKEPVEVLAQETEYLVIEETTEASDAVKEVSCVRNPTYRNKTFLTYNKIMYHLKQSNTHKNNLFLNMLHTMFYFKHLFRFNTWLLKGFKPKIRFQFAYLFFSDILNKHTSFLPHK
jgi:hypothetical protein